MQPAPTLPVLTKLQRPARGGSSRVQVGSHELILERGRGGDSLLWSDGREARRHALGLPDRGELLLELRVPRLPVRVVARDQLILAPGGRLHGYVQVPLVPTLLLREPLGQQRVLIELPNRELAAEWDERAGHTFRVVSPWHLRFPMRSGEPRVVVPMWLRNRGDEVESPGDLAIDLTTTPLHELRGSIVVQPQRLTWGAHAERVAPGTRKVAP
jgi:hypothetical protein